MDTIRVTKEICEPQIFVPNIFSTNGDGINDLFSITINDMNELKFTIYN